jgi:hypothetical protein
MRPAKSCTKLVLILAVCVATYSLSANGQSPGDCQNSGISTGQFCDNNTKFRCVTPGCQASTIQCSNCGFPGCTHDNYTNVIWCYNCNTGSQTDQCVTCNPMICAIGNIAWDAQCQQVACQSIVSVTPACQMGGGGGIQQ